MSAAEKKKTAIISLAGGTKFYGNENDRNLQKYCLMKGMDRVSAQLERVVIWLNEKWVDKGFE